MRKVSASHYGGPNGIYVELGDVGLWFSYQTCVAFRTSSLFAICENVWGCTTGKHLNAIDPDKGKRMSAEGFKRALSDLVSGMEFRLNTFNRVF